MDNPLTLMIPGPTPVPETVLRASARPPISHRSSDFRTLMAEITAHLKWLHQTQNDVLDLSQQRHWGYGSRHYQFPESR